MTEGTHRPRRPQQQLKKTNKQTKHVINKCLTIHPPTPKLTSERKKKKTEREQRRESDLLFAPREIEIGRDRGHGIDVGARRSARSNSGEGQRAAAVTEGGWVSVTKKNLRYNLAHRPRSGVRHVLDMDTTPKMACLCNLALHAFATN